MIQSERLLTTGDGTVWLFYGEVAERGAMRVSLRPVRDGQPCESVFGADSYAPDGCDAVVDSEGKLWIAWTERGVDDDSTVYLSCLNNGTSGPRLQVSTHGPNSYPRIVPDEYGNVWVFWLHPSDTEARWYTCRFGPRSGQAMPVCRGQGLILVSAVSREGKFTVLLAKGLSKMYLVTGTEHGGFGEPVRI